MRRLGTRQKLWNTSPGWRSEPAQASCWKADEQGTLEQHDQEAYRCT